MKGLLIVFEGPEGGGKTTQSNLLVKRLRGLGLDVVYLREPGGTVLGDKIRDTLLKADIDIPAYSELFLFLAARNALIEYVIKPSLKKGSIIILDRFDLSTKAYQISGRKLPERDVLFANQLAKSGIEPDLCFIFMVQPQVGLIRKKNAGKLDRIEREDDDFHERVSDGYRHYGQGEKSFFFDTTHLSMDEVEKMVFLELKKRFPERFPQLG